MKLLYVLFFAAADFFIFSFLHKKGKLTNRHLWAFLAIFFVIGLLHSKLFEIPYLMALNQFLSITQFTATIVIFHFIGKWFISKMDKSDQLPEKSVHLIITLIDYIFLKGIYVFFFLLQCMFIFVNAS